MSVIRPVGTSMECCKCTHKWENTHKTIKKCPNCLSRDFAHPLAKTIDGELWRHSSLLPSYEVSNYGRVRRLYRKKGTYAGKIINGATNHDGYIRINGIFIHILVTNEFIGEKPIGYDCNHKDGVKNNNHIDNLEYVTHKENMIHAARMNLIPYGERMGTHKLTEDNVISIRCLKKMGMNHPTLAKMFNVDQSTISVIIAGKAWKRAGGQCESQII